MKTPNSGVPPGDEHNQPPVELRTRFQGIASVAREAAESTDPKIHTFAIQVLARSVGALPGGGGAK
jgi:hypothetical protein